MNVLVLYFVANQHNLVHEQVQYHIFRTIPFAMYVLRQRKNYSGDYINCQF